MKVPSDYLKSIIFRKKIKSILVMGILSISVLIGCDKESEHVASNPIAYNASNIDNMRILMCEPEDPEAPEPHDEWKKCWCDYSGGNCFPDVVVIGQMAPNYSNFKAAIDANTVDEFFQTTEAIELFPDLEDTGILDDLQSGDIMIIPSIVEHATSGYVLYYGVSASTFNYIESNYDCDQYDLDSGQKTNCLREVFAYIYNEDLIDLTLPVDDSSI